MSTKQKILAALDCALDDLSEARLLDILLDAYDRKKKTIAALEIESASQQNTISRLQSERMHNCARTITGEYFFIVNDRKIAVSIGNHVGIYQRSGGTDWVGYQLPRELWDKRL